MLNMNNKSVNSENIRNFVIIRHIDHGKSTLADRFLEFTGTIDSRHMKPQFLDSLESERERGITIKMAPVRMVYKDYVLNLIDTPGHPDFGYEVSRALAAVEGAILLVDVAQGIQAQTLAKFYAAKKQGLKIIGAVNKIDLAKTFNIERQIKELADLIGCQPEEIHKISGKTGEGVEELLETIIKNIPAPTIQKRAALFEKSVSEPERAWFPPKAGERGRESSGDFLAGEIDSVFSRIKPSAQALIFDSFYDDHKGIIASVRVFSAGGGGEFENGNDIQLIATDERFKIKELGYFS